MKKRKHWWAVCYAHVCRWTDAPTANDAVKLTFGVTPSAWTLFTAEEFPSNPRYMSITRRNAFLDKVFARHKEKTGIEIK